MSRWFKISKYVLHCTIKRCFSSMAPNFVVVNLEGSLRTSALYTEAPPIDSDNLTDYPPYWYLGIRKRCEIGGKLVLFTNRKSHMIWVFYSYQNRWPWMTLTIMTIMTIMMRYFTDFDSVALGPITLKSEARIILSAIKIVWPKKTFSGINYLR